MAFRHTYELVKVLEIDVDIGNEQFSLRLELLQCTLESNCFRAHISRPEFCRIQSTFPQNQEGQPVHQPSDEVIFVNWSYYLSRDYTRFEALSPDDAIQLVLNDIEQVLIKFNPVNCNQD